MKLKRSKFFNLLKFLKKHVYSTALKKLQMVVVNIKKMKAFVYGMEVVYLTNGLQIRVGGLCLVKIVSVMLLGNRQLVA